jgi:hypothetical protein
MLPQVLRAYVRVMARGRDFLHHVMPRMITIWLDYGERVSPFIRYPLRCFHL